MTIHKCIYEKIMCKPAPRYMNNSLWILFMKPIRKFFTNSVAPLCPFNFIRIAIYKMCGFKIGKHVFIGMHCYLDDMCYNLMRIGNNVIISYGVYFACHGRNQGHYPITVEDGAYIGMRACIISKTPACDGVVIGKKSVVGACTLVNRSVPDGMTAVGVPCRIIEK